jgi:hypothetical protein
MPIRSSLANSYIEVISVIAAVFASRSATVPQRLSSKGLYDRRDFYKKSGANLYRIPAHPMLGRKKNCVKSIESDALLIQHQLCSIIETEYDDMLIAIPHMLGICEVDALY